MVAAGYARRIADPADRRRVLVEHTGYLPDQLREILTTVTDYHDATTALPEPAGTTIPLDGL